MTLVVATGTTMAIAPIHVNAIPDEGKRLTLEVEPQEIGLDESDARFRGPLTISAELERADTIVTAEGMIEGISLLECVRCLRPFEWDLSVSFSAEYRPEAVPKKPGPAVSTAEQEEREAGLDEDDEAYTYRKEQVDLAEMLRELVILALPMHPLCKESCLGLCSVCGQDRNIRLCGCQEARPESPFAVLKRKLSGESH